MPQAPVPGSTIPWWQYPSDAPGTSYGQVQDPACQGQPGCYLKPDVNIQVPSGTAITSLLSGTVTSVRDQGWNDGGLSVVVKSDNPINSLATHTAYNFLGSSNVQVGQHVAAGQQLGTAGSPYNIFFALALTTDDIWGNGGFHYNATGNPQLDPHQLLSAASSGNIGALQLGGIQQGVAQQGTQQQGSVNLGGLTAWITNPIRVIKMMVGILLIGIALVLLVVPDTQATIKKAPLLGGLL